MDERPAIDYLSKDFASLRQVMIDRLSATLPLWKERHLPDLGITIVDLLAYVGDYLSYYQDAVATEAYLGSARQRVSVRRHARLLDYVLHEGCNARTWVHVDVGEDVSAVHLEPNETKFIAPVNRLRGAAMAPTPSSTDYEIFEPVARETITLPRAHNYMSVVKLYGTHAVIETHGAEPQKGSVLILQPRQAAGAPAQEPAAPRPVAITAASRRGATHHLVVWHPDDALPGDLMGRKDFVALGNNVLVDHGETFREPATAANGRLSPLLRTGLVHSVPLRRDRVQSAVSMVAQEPRDALANVRLEIGGTEWGSIRPDLLQSLPRQRHFCVELDDASRATVRFGDGLCGERPPDGTAFTLRYRVGRALAGNVVAGAISQIVTDGYNALPNIERVYNPLSAARGIDRESAATVRLVAPGYMRVRQYRAITAEDYADFAQEIAGVQQAAATIIGEGARRVVRVAIHPAGFVARREDDKWTEWQALARRVAARLEPLRRINHDVCVVTPTYVDLRLRVRLEVFSSHRREDVEEGVRRAFFPKDPLGPRDPIFHSDNLKFGQPVYWSRIVATIHKVPGVAAVEQTKFGRGDQPIAKQGDGEVPHVAVGPREIAVLDERNFVIEQT